MPDSFVDPWPPASRGIKSWPMPALPTALARGAIGRCPSCGRTGLFRGYLKIVPVCAHCAAPLGLVRADDAPPYFTILLVGHIVVPLMLLLERFAAPPLWVHMVLWLPLTVILAVVLLRPIKGATVGLMLHLGMMKPEDERDG